MDLRRTLAVTALTLGAVAGVSAPALAATTPAYPPSTPTPSVSSVLPSSSVLPASATRTTSDPGVAVLGVRLARTGSEVATVGVVGALLVVGGVGAVKLSRRSGAHR